MKLEQIQENTVLDEVRMGASDLERFVNSPEAQGIRIGFEAELIFPDMGTSDYSDYEPEYERDRDDESAEDFADISRFFYDGDHNSRNDVQRVIERLEERYVEWKFNALGEAWISVADDYVEEYIREQHDLDKLIAEKLADKLDDDEDIDEVLNKIQIIRKNRSDNQEDMFITDRDQELAAFYDEAEDEVNQEIDDQISDAIRHENSDWDEAKEQWIEYNSDDSDYSEQSFLEDTELDSMLSIFYEYHRYINWPYWQETGGGGDGGGWSDDSARHIANNLSSLMNMEVKVGSYHSVSRKPGRWIIESDGSLEGDYDDDMPAEIVSPPFPLKQGLEVIDIFFNWAVDEYDAKSNKSTGFHVGVSLPFRDGRVDYLKLALFLGDNYVLEKFKRSSNNYCKSALVKITDHIRSKPDKVKDSIELMKHGLIELAQEELRLSHGHGKYTSINLKGNYVEFRSMGGSNYINNKDLVINMIKRYAYAMYLASEPSLERETYYKKLYKLLSENMPREYIDIIQKFSEYSAGKLPRSALTSFIRQAQLARNIKKNSEKIWWKVERPGSYASIEVASQTKEEAIEMAIKEYPDWRHAAQAGQIIVTPIRKY